VTACLVLLALAQTDGGVSTEALQKRLDAQDELINELKLKLEETSAQVRSLDVRLTGRERFHVEVGGYVDLGFFWVQGNGSGVRRDLDHQSTRSDTILPTWVLLGDPLSTTINSRGDAADLTDSRAVRFDAIHSQGRPTFMVNNVNLSLKASVDDRWFLTALVDFLPRERLFGGGGSVGDFIDVKMASLRYEQQFSWGTLTVNAGKFDSLLGLEYRTQEAPQRLTVTPSLICRYTCGRPLGLKARVDLLDSRLEIGAAITNGSSELETFPFSNETDFNFFKSVSGRIVGRFPVLDGLEVVLNAAGGAQDRQRDDSVFQWHVGGGLRLDWGRVSFQGEYVMGRAVGKDQGAVSCGLAPCIFYKGAYGLVGVRVAWYFVPYVRVDWREARLRGGTDYAYDSNVLRATAGLRFEPNSRIAVKAEYTFNRELAFFDFPDDVFTTSFVVSY